MMRCKIFSAFLPKLLIYKNFSLSFLSKISRLHNKQIFSQGFRSEKAGVSRARKLNKNYATVEIGEKYYVC